MLGKRMILLALLLLASSPTAGAAKLWVPDNYQSIQAAINGSGDGDTIIVRSGIYLENIDFQGKNIALVGEQGAEQTIIDGQLAGSCVTFSAHPVLVQTPTLDGFTITGGLAARGGGIFCDGCEPTIVRCRVTGNTTRAGASGSGGSPGGAGGDGGGIYGTATAHPVIVECLIADNTTGAGGHGMTGAGGGRGGSGAGIYCASATISDCEIIANATGAGGGCAWPHLPGDGGGGGGVCCESVTFADCTIASNTTGSGGSSNGTAGHGGSGGGVCCSGFCEFLRCVIEGNASGGGGSGTDAGGDGGAGGGIHAAAPVSVRDCALTGNTTGAGGAAQGGYGYAWGGWGGSGGGLSGSSAIIERTRITANRTGKGGMCKLEVNGVAGDGGRGGGVFCATVSVLSGIIAGNRTGDGGDAMYLGVGGKGGDGAGIYCSGAPLVTNCTFHENEAGGGGQGLLGGAYGLNGEGGGLNGSSCQVANSILWGNQPEQILDTGIPGVRYSNIEHGYAGVANIAVDPRFFDAAAGDFHLTWPSPCRNTGDGTVASLPPLDVEGDPRVADLGVDMGADEFHRHLYVVGQATPGAVVTIRVVGKPTAQPVAVFVSVAVLPKSIATDWGPWYLGMPCSGPFVLSPIPAAGVQYSHEIVPVSVPAPFTYALQALVADGFTNVHVVDVVPGPSN